MNRVTKSAVAATLLCGSNAFAGLWDNIYQGLDYFVTPVGSPINVDGNGFRTNGSRAGRLRIVPNALGQGYRLEMDRVFGGDNSGRPEVFDLGNFELELSGSSSTTLSFTSRLLPTGNAQTSLANLSYVVRGKNGAQDMEIQGTLNGSSNLEINPLGFYTYSLDLSNSDSQVSVDGVIVNDSTKDTDFDIGPISVQGNIYYDILTSTLNSFGVATSGLEQLFPESPIDRVTREIQESLASQAKALEDRIQSDLVSGVQDQQLALAAHGLISQALDSAGGVGPVDPNTGAGQVPEPSGLALLIVGGLSLLRRTVR